MKTTFAATGDSFITKSVPENGYEGFDEIRKVIEDCDVRFCNLEITVHNKEGFPAAFSGGTWAQTDTSKLDDLKRFGFNIFNTANNHSMDYSYGGLLATIRNLKENNMVYAGTGEDMEHATAPGYLDTPNGRVALIGVSASFHDSDRAGNNGIHVGGRPGLNTLRFTTVYQVEHKYMEQLKNIAAETKMNVKQDLRVENGFARPLPEGRYWFGGLQFTEGDSNRIITVANKTDTDRIMQSIREAKKNADYVLVSFHHHEMGGTKPNIPAEFAEVFSRNCIDNGADAVLGHGPHELRGIEIYKDKPIFYSLGNFIFQTDVVDFQPADAFENAGMPQDTTVEAYMDRRSKNGTSGYIVQPEIWRSVIATFAAENGKITEVKLYPITLHMEYPKGKIRFPNLSHDDSTIEYLSSLSKPYGTVISNENGVGVIKIGG